MSGRYLGLTGLCVLALLAAPVQAKPLTGALTESQVRDQILGRRLTTLDQSKSWAFWGDGEFDAPGVASRHLEYDVWPGGRLCWKANFGAKTCLRFTRRGGIVHVWRADPGHQEDLGAVTLKDL